MILEKENLKNKCYGCYACANACPKKCITLVEDKEGFRYPKVDENYCNNTPINFLIKSCCSCEKACPIGKNARELHPDILDEPDAYACYILDEEAHKRSMSGGIAYAISEHVIRQGGVVFGAVGKAIERVYHTAADTIDDVYPMCGSKYVQSDIGETYSQAEKSLKTGRFVLYTGTSCQIAGLYAFLKIAYDNLITCDLICHGVPSQKVLKTYIKEYEERAGKKVIHFGRSNANGFIPVKYVMQYDDASCEFLGMGDSYYRQGYKYHLFLRASCYICEYARIPRISDFTLGDLWCDNTVLKRLDPQNTMGLSLITVNTDKAKKIIDEISENIYKEDLDFQKAKNQGYVSSPPRYNKNRQKFFNEFYKNGFEKAFLKHGKPKFSLIKFAKKVIIVILHRLGLFNFVRSLVKKYR